jgi:protocatechuate 3,4-dioxygenase alpha subunit
MHLLSALFSETVRGLRNNLRRNSCWKAMASIVNNADRTRGHYYRVRESQVNRKRQFTPQATLGPFYPGAFALDSMPNDLSIVGATLSHRPEGQRIRLSGHFLDSNGVGVPSLIVESWQANAHGRYRHPLDESSRPLDPQFDGFARIRTLDDGSYSLATIKPGARSPRAPHLRLTIFASGIDRIVTQIFFEDEPLNTCDPVLLCIPDVAVRSRLIAKRQGDGEYALDIIMRGDEETPFLDDWAE